MTSLARETAAAQIIRAVGPITVKLPGEVVRAARRGFGDALDTAVLDRSALKACVRVLRVLQRVRTADAEVSLTFEAEDAVSVGLTMRMLGRSGRGFGASEQLELVGAAMFDAARVALRDVGAPEVGA